MAGTGTQQDPIALDPLEAEELVDLEQLGVDTTDNQVNPGVLALEAIALDASRVHPKAHERQGRPPNISDGHRYSLERQGRVPETLLPPRAYTAREPVAVGMDEDFSDL